MTSTRFLDRPEWKAHCENWSGFAGSPLLRTLLAELDSRDLSELVERYQNPQLAHEARACEQLFRLLLKNRDPRFGTDDRQALADVLYHRVMNDRFHQRKEHERWLLSELWAMAMEAPAVDLFIQTAPTAGAYNVDLFRGLVVGPLNRGIAGELAAYLPVFPDVVLGSDSIPAIDLAECDARLCHVLVGHLIKSGSPRAIDAIRQLELLGGDIRELALVARQILQDAPQDPIEALCEKWRASRDSESLCELYRRYFDVLPVGTSMKIWLRRLGEPSTAADRFASYATMDGRHTLYVELDSENRLSGISLKEC